MMISRKLTDEWFKKEVLYTRYTYVLFWSLIIQATLLWTVKVFGVPIVSVFGLPPVSISAVIFSQMYLAILLICLCFLFYRSIKVYPNLPGSPLSAIYEILRPYNWLEAGCFAALGAFWSQCLLYTTPCANYYHFWQQTPECVQESSVCCVNEHHFFVFLHGAFIGTSFCFNYYTQHMYCLKFETVKQLKFPSTKISLRKQIISSALVVLKSIRYYYLIYYLLGFIPKYIVTQYLGQSFCDNSSLTTLSGLFDLQLLCTTFFLGFFIHASWSSVLTLIQIFLTERIHFPIETSFEKEQAQLLSNALSPDNNELLQHLAFQDLSNVSQYSSVERRKLFAISIPGGHPRVWNQILSQCLEIIDKFQASLHHAVAVNTASAKSTTGSHPIAGGFLSRTSQSNGLPQLSVTTNPLNSPQWSPDPSFRTSSLRARNMASQAIVSEQSASVVQNGKAYAQKGYIMDNFEKLLDNLMNRSVMKFLISEPNERKIEKLYCKSLLVIWSVEALSFLVKASYTEDQNGVVQWSLPKIISTLLELQIAMERSPKGLMRNSCGRDSWLAVPSSLFLKQSLHAAVSSGIYHITCTFRQHLKYVELSDEHQKRIDRYLQMKE